MMSRDEQEFGVNRVFGMYALASSSVKRRRAERTGLHSYPHAG